MAKKEDQTEEVTDESAGAEAAGAEGDTPAEESTAAQSTEAATADQKKTSAPTQFLNVGGGKVATSIDVKGMTRDFPRFNVGDTVKVHYRIREGDKQRVQVYEGNVIARRGAGLDETFIVRRVSHEVGVERIFPYHSPAIEKVEVIRRGVVRQARLFYLRHKSGKEGRIKEAFDYSLQKKQSDGTKKKKTRRKKATKAKEPATAAPATTAAASTETTPAAE
ncbi:MAG: 50S ribosomal protein L19 [Leptospiraceae bacterium]|nr:50S ribosomal protein L19 [Leptospiraceae bacterium]MCB1323079.1 50S ribosomal protein L19 [Leptospiraceae bacterium]